ncbi:hypothetical protein Cantr_02613 [Candida viswanathii]|uniref:pH-response transcription factor pacC/RIM101 n=1 Tax=Candida viswanathii TaxID=5486 RepID=A0A367YQ11_9ASCO|nr:hypothetical protein Cantr_02613 [Candida viswanathii]
MPYSQVQSSLPPQFMDYPQQYFPQQSYQQQQLQAQAQHQQQIQLMMQQQPPHLHHQQQQQQQQPQQAPAAAQTPQQYSQPSSQNENYYFQATRSYAYSQGLASSNSTTNLQQYPLNEPRQSGAVPPSVTPTDKTAASSSTTTATTPHFSSDQYNYLVPSLPPLNQIGATPPNTTQHQQQQHYDVSPLASNYVPDNSHFAAPLLDPSRQATSSVPPPKKGRKRRHTATVHDMTPETAERNRCRICNKQFKRPSSLQTHYYSHTGEKIFKCPWDSCGKLFSVKSNMTRHYRLHERDLRRAQEREMQSRDQQQVPPPPSSQQQQQQQQMQPGLVSHITHAPPPPLQPQLQPPLAAHSAAGPGSTGAPHQPPQQETFFPVRQEDHSASRPQYPTYLSSTSNLPMSGSDSAQ